MDTLFCQSLVWKGSIISQYNKIDKKTKKQKNKKTEKQSCFLLFYFLSLDKLDKPDDGKQVREPHFTPFKMNMINFQKF